MGKEGVAGDEPKEDKDGRMLKSGKLECLGCSVG